MKLLDRPYLADCEIEIMDSIFQAQRPRRVLEWGAGGSTLHWPQKYAFVEEWIAIEHDEEFANEVLGRADAKVQVLQLDPPQYWRWAERLGSFDLIIVDGLHRVECLKAARGLLAEGGIVVLHDSGRSVYNEAWKPWPCCEELYPGEKSTGDGYYKHRGITVFWDGVQELMQGWCRDYKADPLERPKYKLPRKQRAKAEPEPVAEVAEDAEPTDIYTPATLDL